MTDKRGPYYTGTLWEKLNQDGTDVDANASLAHGWATGPVLEPERLRARRAPGDPGLQDVDRSRPSRARSDGRRARSRRRQGALVSRWRRGHRDSSLTLTMAAPDGTSGTVAVPELGRSRTITMDCRVVWRHGAAAAGVTAAERDGAVQFTGVTGSHTFAWGPGRCSPS